MQPDQIAGLLTATALVMGSLAALVTAIGGTVIAARKPKGDSPTPQVGITATVSDGDIDLRAYEDMKTDRDYWRDLYQQKHPDPGSPGRPSRKDTP